MSKKIGIQTKLENDLEIRSKNKISKKKSKKKIKK